MDAILEKKKQSEAKKIIFDPFSGEQRQTVPSIIFFIHILDGIQRKK